jgi:hypothetical protein
LPIPAGSFIAGLVRDLRLKAASLLKQAKLSEVGNERKHQSRCMAEFCGFSNYIKIEAESARQAFP